MEKEVRRMYQKQKRIRQKELEQQDTNHTTNWAIIYNSKHYIRTFQFTFPLKFERLTEEPARMSFVADIIILPSSIYSLTEIVFCVQQPAKTSFAANTIKYHLL